MDVHLLHIPKTAGTSMRNALCVEQISETATRDEATSVLDRGGHVCTGHNSPEDLARIGVEGHPFFDRAYTITVVRNPWDRMLSYWWFIQNVSYRHDHRWVIADFETFCGKLAERTADKDWGQGLTARERLAPQVEWLRWRIDNLIRFENLDAGWLDVCRRVGGGLTLPHDNKRNGFQDYREHYTPTAREAVAQAHALDVERLGYEF